jgi:membrane protease YdiL (CAAX protease family)
MIFYFVASISVGRLMHVYNLNMPIWMRYGLSQLIILTPGLIYVLVMKINVVKCMPYRLLKPVDALLALLFGYALIPFVNWINIITQLFATNYLQESQSELMSYPVLTQLLLVAVIPPLVEEFMFRGLFYHSYRKNGILGAALVSGFIFGIFHLNLNQFCYAFVIGIIFALLVEATGSMMASIIAHFAINSYSIVLQNIIYGAVPKEQLSQMTSASIRDYSPQMIIFMLIFLGTVGIVFLLLAYLILKKLSERNGRWNYFNNEVRKGVRAQNGERFISIPAAVTMLLCIIYMITIEFA